MYSNLNEKSLESTLVMWLAAHGWEQGDGKAEFDRSLCLDTGRLWKFLETTQPEEAQKIAADKKKFFERLRDEITKRGVVDVLKNGVRFYPVDNVVLLWLPPTPGNKKAAALYAQNIWCVTRQLHFSLRNEDSIDLCLMVNGIPVVTAELKNEFTHQDTACAVRQYKRDRDPSELLFQFKRCAAHFAVDDMTVQYCTRLMGAKSVFLPFDKGNDGHAGNPPNGDVRTNYLWREIWAKDSLAEILVKFVKAVEEENPKTKKTKLLQIWPRYHQLDAVRKLVADVSANGVGKRYLIQHSAGSGKSNTIAWLAYHLIGLRKNDKPIIDTVIVATDRRVLDKQTKKTMGLFAELKSTVAWAKNSGELKKAVEAGRHIIVTTIQKFPMIAEDAFAAKPGAHFGVIIDEAHSSQSGKMSQALSKILHDVAGDIEDDEDVINALIKQSKFSTNASYFAFTATPKNKTLELFGTALPPDKEGKVGYVPFHVYTMRQAIEEGFIRNPLENYSTVKASYELIKKVADNPEFDKAKAASLLKSFANGQPVTIAQKARLIIDHFTAFVANQIGGEARAMVVCSSIANAVEMYQAIVNWLKQDHSTFKALVAFSGKVKLPNGLEVDQDYFNNPVKGDSGDNGIAGMFPTGNYRFLVVADKFQTGYDEPLLDAMYVDKELADIKAVQTLSRLNRIHPNKVTTFVLDFHPENAQMVQEAFSKYYLDTGLADKTDPNKLFDLLAEVEKLDLFTKEDVEKVVDWLVVHPLPEDKRGPLDDLLNKVADGYKTLCLEEQVKFKGAAKAYVRTYDFLSMILSGESPYLFKMAVFLYVLIPKLPSPPSDDERDLLANVTLEKLLLDQPQKQEMQLESGKGIMNPVPVATAAAPHEAELDPIDVILQRFNAQNVGIVWQNKDMVEHIIKSIPWLMSKNEDYVNAVHNSDKDHAKIEAKTAFMKLMAQFYTQSAELYGQVSDNPAFASALIEAAFDATYKKIKDGVTIKEPAPPEMKTTVGSESYSLPGETYLKAATKKPNASEYGK